MIPSILWNDAYKIFMQQIAHRVYPNVMAHYQLMRHEDIEFYDGFAADLQSRVHEMADLRVSTPEYLHIKYRYPYLNEEYVEWFRNYRYDPTQIHISQYGTKVNLEVFGPWETAIMWEVPLMGTIVDLLNKHEGRKPAKNYLEVAEEKCVSFADHNMTVIEGGTRRSFSPDTHANLYKVYHKYGIPTSNIRLAMDYDEVARGTYAHELVMLHAALFGVRYANNYTIMIWDHEFDPQHNPALSTSLVDTYTTDFYFKNTPVDLINKFDNYRQDSGNPIDIGCKILTYTKQYELINKGIVFSDSLNVSKAIKLQHQFEDKCRVAFLIGTNLTNDVGHKPYDLVIKPVSFSIPSEGKFAEVAKISDSEGKHSGPPNAIEEALAEINAEW